MDTLDTGPATENTTPTTEAPKEKPTAVNEPQPEAVKLEYSNIKLCTCMRHGFVSFNGESHPTPLSNLADIARISAMMDEESVKRFLSDVEYLQSMGKLGNVMTLEMLAETEYRRRVEQEKQARKEQLRQQQNAMRKELCEAVHGRLEILVDDINKVAMSGLSNHSLVKPLTDVLERAMDKAELNDVYTEMANRNMVITIGVVRVPTIDMVDKLDIGNARKIANLVIDPQNLISTDVSEEIADLEDERDEIAKHYQEELDNINKMGR